MIGFVDSTIIIHLLRGNSQAQEWLTQQNVLGITPIVWLEVLDGAKGRLGQAVTIEVLQSFDMVYLTQADQIWSIDTFVKYRLSKGVAINDCLIAAVCHRLQLPIYTHNVKHLARILDPALVIQPY